MCIAVQAHDAGMYTDMVYLQNPITYFNCAKMSIHATTKLFVLFCSAHDSEPADMNCLVF